MSDWLNIEDLDGAWERLDDEDRSSVLMWRAVVGQAIRDLASIDRGVVYEAAVWLDTDDYRDVCELALLDPVSLLTAIKRAIETSNPLYRKTNTTRLSDALMAWSGPAPDQEG